MTRLQTAFAPFLRPRVSSLFDQFFDEALGDRLPEAFTRQKAPALNVAESDKAIMIELELPGLNEEDIDVQVTGDQLIVNAKRKFESEQKDLKYHRLEHQYGAFTRSLTLPRELRTDAIEAEYKKGVLRITLPKVEPTPSQKIAIKSE